MGSAGALDDSPQASNCGAFGGMDFPAALQVVSLGWGVGCL